eukprot:scaffold6156_cov243-Chaetoceros_neogracile.AAC.1
MIAVGMSVSYGSSGFAAVRGKKLDTAETEQIDNIIVDEVRRHDGVGNTTTNDDTNYRQLHSLDCFKGTNCLEESKEFSYLELCKATQCEEEFRESKSSCILSFQDELHWHQETQNLRNQAILHSVFALTLSFCAQRRRERPSR